MSIPVDSLSYPCLATIQHFAIPETRQGDVYEFGQRLREALTNGPKIILVDYPISMRPDEIMHLQRLYVRVAEQYSWRNVPCP